MASEHYSMQSERKSPQSWQEYFEVFDPNTLELEPPIDKSLEGRLCVTRNTEHTCVTKLSHNDAEFYGVEKLIKRPEFYRCRECKGSPRYLQKKHFRSHAERCHPNLLPSEAISKLNPVEQINNAEELCSPETVEQNNRNPFEVINHAPFPIFPERTVEPFRRSSCSTKNSSDCEYPSRKKRKYDYDSYGYVTQAPMSYPPPNYYHQSFVSADPWSFPLGDSSSQVRATPSNLYISSPDPGGGLALDPGGGMAMSSMKAPPYHHYMPPNHPYSGPIYYPHSSFHIADNYSTEEPVALDLSNHQPPPVNPSPSFVYNLAKEQMQDSNLVRQDCQLHQLSYPSHSSQIFSTSQQSINPANSLNESLRTETFPIEERNVTYHNFLPLQNSTETDKEIDASDETNPIQNFLCSGAASNSFQIHKLRGGGGSNYDYDKIINPCQIYSSCKSDLQKPVEHTFNVIENDFPNCLTSSKLGCNENSAKNDVKNCYVSSRGQFNIDSLVSVNLNNEYNSRKLISEDPKNLDSFRSLVNPGSNIGACAPYQIRPSSHSSMISDKSECATEDLYDAEGIDRCFSPLEIHFPIPKKPLDPEELSVAPAGEFEKSLDERIKPQKAAEENKLQLEELEGYKICTPEPEASINDAEESSDERKEPQKAAEEDRLQLSDLKGVQFWTSESESSSDEAPEEPSDERKEPQEAAEEDRLQLSDLKGVQFWTSESESSSDEAPAEESSGKTKEPQKADSYEGNYKYQKTFSFGPVLSGSVIMSCKSSLKPFNPDGNLDISRTHVGTAGTVVPSNGTEEVQKKNNDNYCNGSIDSYDFPHCKTIQPGRRLNNLRKIESKFPINNLDKHKEKGVISNNERSITNKSVNKRQGNCKLIEPNNKRHKNNEPQDDVIKVMHNMLHVICCLGPILESVRRNRLLASRSCYELFQKKNMPIHKTSDSKSQNCKPRVLAPGDNFKQSIGQDVNFLSDKAKVENDFLDKSAVDPNYPKTFEVKSEEENHTPNSDSPCELNSSSHKESNLAEEKELCPPSEVPLESPLEGSKSPEEKQLCLPIVESSVELKSSEEEELQTLNCESCFEKTKSVDSALNVESPSDELKSEKELDATSTESPSEELKFVEPFQTLMNVSSNEESKSLVEKQLYSPIGESSCEEENSPDERQFIPIGESSCKEENSPDERQLIPIGESPFEEVKFSAEKQQQFVCPIDESSSEEVNSPDEKQLDSPIDESSCHKKKFLDEELSLYTPISDSSPEEVESEEEKELDISVAESLDENLLLIPTSVELKVFSRTSCTRSTFTVHTVPNHVNYSMVASAGVRSQDRDIDVDSDCIDLTRSDPQTKLKNLKNASKSGPNRNRSFIKLKVAGIETDATPSSIVSSSLQGQSPSDQEKSARSFNYLSNKEQIGRLDSFLPRKEVRFGEAAKPIQPTAGSSKSGKLKNIKRLHFDEKLNVWKNVLKRGLLSGGKKLGENDSQISKLKKMESSRFGPLELVHLHRKLVMKRNLLKDLTHIISPFPNQKHCDACVIVSSKLKVSSIEFDASCSRKISDKKARVNSHFSLVNQCTVYQLKKIFSRENLVDINSNIQKFYQNQITCFLKYIVSIKDPNCASKLECYINSLDVINCTSKLECNSSSQDADSSSKDADSNSQDADSNILDSNSCSQDANSNSQEDSNFSSKLDYDSNSQDANTVGEDDLHCYLCKDSENRQDIINFSVLKEADTYTALPSAVVPFSKSSSYSVPPVTDVKLNYQNKTTPNEFVHRTRIVFCSEVMRKEFQSNRSFVQSDIFEGTYPNEAYCASYHLPMSSFELSAEKLSSFKELSKIRPEPLLFSIDGLSWRRRLLDWRTYARHRLKTQNSPKSIESSTDRTVLCVSESDTVLVPPNSDCATTSCDIEFKVGHCSTPTANDGKQDALSQRIFDRTMHPVQNDLQPAVNVAELPDAGEMPIQDGENSVSHSRTLPNLETSVSQIENSTSSAMQVETNLKVVECNNKALGPEPESIAVTTSSVIDIASSSSKFKVDLENVSQNSNFKFDFNFKKRPLNGFIKRNHNLYDLLANSKRQQTSEHNIFESSSFKRLKDSDTLAPRKELSNNVSGLLIEETPKVLNNRKLFELAKLKGCEDDPSGFRRRIKKFTIMQLKMRI